MFRIYLTDRHLRFLGTPGGAGEVCHGRVASDNPRPRAACC